MRSARLALALLLTTSLGCAQKDWIDRTLVTESVTGVWQGSMTTSSGPASREEVRLELEQKGPNVTGLFRGDPIFVGSLRGTTPIEGNMAGDLFKFRDARGLLIGELTVGGDEMTGQGTLGGNRRVTFILRRVDSAGSPLR